MSVTSSGARLVFRVNGTKVAFANAVSFTRSHALSPVDVLDNIVPAEYAETGVTVSFTANMFRVSNQGPISIGLMPKIQDVLTQPELTAEIVDRITGATIALIERVKCSQMDFSSSARDLATTNLSFTGIWHSDEAGR